jgi:hypothetical protein
LLGSRQDILFCEGEIGSLDEQVYGILFPNYTVKPVGGCLSVIDFTKAFNKLPMSTRKAIGVVDGDFISQKRRNSLRHEGIFTVGVPDIENLLLDEALLTCLAEDLSLDRKKVDKIKEAILKMMINERDIEVAKYVSAKVDHYFKDTNVAASSNLENLKLNYNNFTNDVAIDSWASERTKQLNDVISKGDYSSAIQIFKNKGLASAVNTGFGIRDFAQKAIEILRRNSNLQNELRKYLPDIPLNPKL